MIDNMLHKGKPINSDYQKNIEKYLAERGFNDVYMCICDDVEVGK